MTRMEIDSVRDAAARVLAEMYGDVRLDDTTPLDGSDRSAVLRFSVAGGLPGAPSSIVVKRTVGLGDEDDDPSHPDSPTIRFFNEWASLQFLGEVVPDRPVAPRLYGGDREAGILVMEDLGPVIGLAESLLGDDPAAARADLVAYSTTVGRLHARTAPHVARFNQMRDALGPPHPGFGEAWIVPAFHATLDALGLSPTPTIDDDLAILAASMADPGPFAALIHTDPCPGNWTRLDDGDRLIDFEYSRIGPALMDGVFGRVPFPTCWCVGVLPEPVANAMAHAYRTELARGCPAALDDVLYARAEVEACAFWLILLCHWHPLADLFEEAREWGTATIRQRLLTRLEVVAEVTTAAGHLIAIGELAGVMRQALRERWAGEVTPLPPYPAFRTSWRA
jgi:hypothetical protein